MDNKISLFLMTYKGFRVLEYLIPYFKETVDLVVASKDSKLQNDYFEEIKNTCLAKQIPFKNRNEVNTINATYVMAISWRWIIDKSEAKPIVLHDSLLPKYRGFNPLCLINGGVQIGVTALFATEEYDRGDIIAQSRSTEQILHNYIDLVHKVCTQISNKILLVFLKTRILLPYSLWRDEEDYQIDWNKNCQEIRRMVDAVRFPYVGAQANIHNKTIS